MSDNEILALYHEHKTAVRIVGSLLGLMVVSLVVATRKWEFHFVHQLFVPCVVFWGVVLFKWYKNGLNQQQVGCATL